MRLATSSGAPALSHVILHEQAVEFQRIGLHMLGALRDFHLAWPERILRPVQYVRGIVTASPWIVNTVAISRELGELADARDACFTATVTADTTKTNLNKIICGHGGMCRHTRFRSDLIITQADLSSATREHDFIAALCSGCHASKR